MWSWLSKIDPNVIVGLATLVGGYIWHKLSPSTQASIAADLSQAQKNALAVADQVMAALAIAAAVEGKTPEQLRAQLYAAAKVQLGHIGLDPDKLPPAVIDAIDSLVGKYVAGYRPK